MNIYLIKFKCEPDFSGQVVEPGYSAVLAKSVYDAIYKFISQWMADYSLKKVDISPDELMEIKVVKWCSQEDAILK